MTSELALHPLRGIAGYLLIAVYSPAASRCAYVDPATSSFTVFIRRCCWHTHRRRSMRAGCESAMRKLIAMPMLDTVSTTRHQSEWILG
ncbi:MAG: hypothetical protein U5L46_01740 [Agrobacterium sp.]|nr:hypothetical protein [Agrobacterium sp.]